MPSKHPPLLTTRGTISHLHLLLRFRLLFHPNWTLPSRGPRHERCDPSRAIVILDQSQSLPPMLSDPGTLPEHIVDAVRNLKPLLPSGCELLGQEDLKITGSCPIDAGGFADVWVGEMNDGTKVAIKSYRYYSSSSCLPVYLVSDQRYRKEFRPLDVIDRGCTRKH